MYDNENHDSNIETNQHDDVQHEQTEQSNHVTASKRTNKFGMFFSGIIGGLVVAVLGVLLVSTNILPLSGINSSSETDPQVASESTSNDSNIVQTSNNNSNSSLTDAIDQAAGAVVGVSNIQQTNMWEESQAAGTGSGVIYKKEDGKAYVVTNNHVVEGANEVEVILPNGEHVAATILGADSLTDLAVLEIDGAQVDTVAAIGSSEELSVGETAIAIGNPLGMEFAGSVTKGIISGVERSVEMDANQDGQADWTTEVIQTDAAINPGNSGGALVNENGELIGINSMKIAQEEVEGIGFAIPIDSALPIMEQLETDGNVSRPFIGISAIELSSVPNEHRQKELNLSDDITDGVVVAQVQNGSPANNAGLKQYDVITKINDQPIASMLELKEYLYSETGVGEKVDITFYRNGKEQTTSLTLSEQQA
ncbi:S1C family serine protease [Sediminibacillus massiliensis]|uniref:S1C family serine protease n=1 Tax=Sediminibacillus massiliensis TaxID=1926277 RepID=UPI0009885A42|nr:trypsin-like peptidase domain-containing protein [Sediminibacillus massiliensis]